MPERYRIQLYWAPRRESLDVMGRRLREMVDAMGDVHPLLTSVRAERGDGDVAVASVEDCVRLLAEGAESWTFGREEHTAHEVRLFVRRPVAPPWSATLTCGIEPEHVGGLFAPNRLEMWLRPDAPDALATPGTIQALLGGAAAVWEADFGYVGTATQPPAPPPLTSAGVPPVGWMTYLSNRWPAPPVTLRAPAVTYPVEGQGWVVVAHPNLHREHKKDHLAAVEAVAVALDEAAVLRPAVQTPA